MAIIITNHEYSVNFIDSNDCFVGYDMNQQCCESFGYIVKIGDANHDSSDIGVSNDLKLRIEKMLENDFLPSEILEDHKYTKSDVDERHLDIHLVDASRKPSGNIITLYNYHNGYYYHEADYKLSGGSDSTFL